MKIMRPKTFDDSLFSWKSDFWEIMANLETEFEKKEYGRFLQFQLIDLNLMQLQHQTGTAIQLNNFEMDADAWKWDFPDYFVLNRTNYSRYWSYCAQILKHIDDNHDGLNNLLVVCALPFKA